MSTIADIQLEILDLCDADTTSYPAATMLRHNNHDYETVVGWILNADGRWQFDDSNFTTFPIGTTTLVSGQNDYTFDNTQLKILKVEIMNNAGKYYPIYPIDIEDIKKTGVSVSQYAPTSGAPVQYDVQGGSIILYPAPDNGLNVTLAVGLKVYYQRTAAIFTSAEVTTGTKQPGFASIFHMILAYMGAIPYCIKYQPERVQAYQTKIAQMKAELEKFYSKRDKDERQIMTPKKVLYI